MFEACLVYILSSRKARAIQINPVSKKKKKKKKKKRNANIGKTMSILQHSDTFLELTFFGRFLNIMFNTSPDKQ